LGAVNPGEVQLALNTPHPFIPGLAGGAPGFVGGRAAGLYLPFTSDELPLALTADAASTDYAHGPPSPLRVGAGEGPSEAIVSANSDVL